MSQESNTGVKLLSSFQRALVRVSYPAPGVHLPAGLTTVQIPLPAQPVRAPGVGLNFWPLTRNFRYRFSASILFTSAGPEQVSTESAGMVLADQADNILMSNAGRLSSLTALAQDNNISFDDWLIDTNDLLSLVAGDRTLQQFFRLWLYIVVNNTGVAPREYNATGHFQSDAAQFDNYRFSKWE